jgi:hypothetical protein
MKKLGARNYALIENGVKTHGSYDPNEIFYLFEEHLYVHEWQEVWDFLQWVHDNQLCFGSGNYERCFTAFKKYGQKKRILRERVAEVTGFERKDY